MNPPIFYIVLKFFTIIYFILILNSNNRRPCLWPRQLDGQTPHFWFHFHFKCICLFKKEWSRYNLNITNCFLNLSQTTLWFKLVLNLIKWTLGYHYTYSIHSFGSIHIYMEPSENISFLKANFIYNLKCYMNKSFFFFTNWTPAVIGTLKLLILTGKKATLNLNFCFIDSNLTEDFVYQSNSVFF